MTKTSGVTLESSALAFSTTGVIPDKWLQETAGKVWSAIQNGVQSAVNLGKRMFEGGKELISAIARGDWNLFRNWFRDDPGGAIAGGLAVAVGGWFVGSASGLFAAASAGISGMWASLGALKIGGVSLGLFLPTLQQAIVSTGNTLYNIEWGKSDAAILAQLNSSYLGFLGNVGESTGRMLAGLMLGGAKKNSKLTINITATAALIITAKQDGNDIEEELIQELSQLANTFLKYATQLAGQLGYLELRKYARQNVRTGVNVIDQKIKNWGLQEGETWSVARKIEDKVEKISEKNPALGTFLENFLEGFGDGLSDFILLT